MTDRPEVATDDAPASTAKSGQAGRAPYAIPGDDRNLVGRAVTINRPRAELYAYWRDFANLATFMDNVERVDVVDGRTSHWVVKAPGGRIVEWDSVLTEDRDGELIAWSSTEGADVPNSGRIEFRDAGARGTVVTATISYDPPAGAIGKLVAKIFQREPAIQARRDLRRFKQLMETGEVATASRNAREYEEKG